MLFLFCCGGIVEYQWRNGCGIFFGLISGIVSWGGLTREKKKRKKKNHTVTQLQGMKVIIIDPNSEEGGGGIVLLVCETFAYLYCGIFKTIPFVKELLEEYKENEEEIYRYTRQINQKRLNG